MSLAVAERPAVEAVVDVFRLLSSTTEGKQHWGPVEEAECLALAAQATVSEQLLTC